MHFDERLLFDLIFISDMELFAVDSDLVTSAIYSRDGRLQRAVFKCWDQLPTARQSRLTLLVALRNGTLLLACIDAICG